MWRDLRFHNRRTCAFTLIELLVVISIIAMLVGILLPSLSRARNQGKVVSCLSKMRELGRYTHIFNAENGDFMPKSTHSGFKGRQMIWWTNYYAYITGTPYPEYQTPPDWMQILNNNYRCPMDLRRGTDQWSYGYNVYFELTEQESGDFVKPGPTWRKSSMTPRPGATVVFAEKNEDPKIATMSDHVMAHFWTKFNASTNEVSKSRHKPKSGYVFLDGHAENLEFEKTFDRDRQRDNWNPVAAR